MKKIVDYIKKNYILCMVFIAVFLIVVGSILIIKLLVPKKEAVYPKTRIVEYYEYFETQKNEYTATITYKDDVIETISCKDCSMYENTFPYYKDKTKITLLKPMSIVFYYQGSLSYKLPCFAEIEHNEGSNIIYTGGKEYLTDDFFIFDGEDLYFFISDTTLTVNGVNYELSKYSYIFARNNELLYYDHDSDKAVLLPNVVSASVRVGAIDIDLLKDVIVDQNSRILLSNEVNYLPEFKEN